MGWETFVHPQNDLSKICNKMQKWFMWLTYQRSGINNDDCNLIFGRNVWISPFLSLLLALIAKWSLLSGVAGFLGLVSLKEWIQSRGIILSRSLPSKAKQSKHTKEKLEWAAPRQDQPSEPHIVDFKEDLMNIYVVSLRVPRPFWP